MRLDAVPYLVEREGTDNENLPETHQILKRIRAEVDAHYKDRMLLAEANQWPEDTQEYFGAGDECHMAFHFPLMPRMYMAIAQEDRFPVTDIMRQTPDIPQGCQWAIFLRNHDELTLEMVTDRERDYLWSVYAADRRARINLGIRRRLAPLMERDRRRIELMNFMLFTMPGTPVLYYGDEIGMGDNIHLGDRDGVRTPMQWSPDRNGGFSRADPAGLVLPPIADPLYGYEVVNVEAQSRDPHSLLNWLRRMLAVRKEHRAFGRGTLRFLRPQNRKILAYLREYEDDVILCVANVSRTAQAVELDLSEFAGRTPLEMSGKTAFPTIGQLTYLLTLPPYGFYWFQMCENLAGPNWSTSMTSAAPEHYTFVVREAFASVAENGNRGVLEADVLPGYVAARRWFAAKNAELRGVRIAAVSPLPGGFDQVMTQIEVETSLGTARYTLPLGAAWEDEASGPFAPNLALARVRRGRRVGHLTDAFFNPAFARAVLLGLKENARLPTPEGELVFEAAGPLDLSDEPELEWLAAEQSNSTVVMEHRAVLKLLRKVESGVHPEAEMTRFLTERGFRNAPQLLGEVREELRDGSVRTLMVVQGFVYSQGDAWTWTLDYLKRRADDLAMREDAESEPAFPGYESFARTLGLRLGEMHAALSQPSRDPAFAPEPAGEEAVQAWADGVRGQLGAALAAVSAHGDWPDLDERAAAGRLLAEHERLMALVGELAAAGRGSRLTRIHGDLHLGQVLVTGGDATIIDFEGEPARSLAERRAKSSPLKDVAGVLRSIDYAAAVAARGPVADPAAAERARALLQHFRASASAAFLEGYAETRGPADGPLLDLFLLEKAAYEVCYEASSRPDWIGVPLMGLAALAQRLLDRQESADS
jgi:maltose alpha-D-glucosyltransferase/alpha-amylase